MVEVTDVEMKDVTDTKDGAGTDAAEVKKDPDLLTVEGI
jgi:hypothetical protein